MRLRRSLGFCTSHGESIPHGPVFAKGHYGAACLSPSYNSSFASEYFTDPSFTPVPGSCPER